MEKWKGDKRDYPFLVYLLHYKNKKHKQIKYKILITTRESSRSLENSWVYS